MRDFSDDLKELRRRLGEAEGYLKIPSNRARLSELEFEVARPDLWDDQELAKRVNADLHAWEDSLDLSAAERSALGGAIGSLAGAIDGAPDPMAVPRG